MCMGIAWVSFGGYAVSAWGVDYIMRFKPEYMPSPDNNKFEVDYVLAGNDTFAWIWGWNLLWSCYHREISTQEH